MGRGHHRRPGPAASPPAVHPSTEISVAEADADLVLVLDGGVVVESGSPALLLAMDGRYAALVRAAERAQRLTGNVPVP